MMTENRPYPATREETRPCLTVIVPVFNEQATVACLLSRVVEMPRLHKEIIVVDDSSTDSTENVLRRWEVYIQEARCANDGSLVPSVTIVRHERNRGKGAAIRTGLEYARGDWTIVQDADLEYDPADYKKLMRPLLRGQADVVYGSRRLGKPLLLREMLNPFYHGVTLLNLLVRLWYGVHITDEATCYKVFPTEILRAMELRCQRFEFCPEVTAKACRMGLKIVEVPIGYRGRSLAEGKKVRFRDGVQAVVTLWRLRNWRPVRTVQGAGATKITA